MIDPKLFACKCGCGLCNPSPKLLGMLDLVEGLLKIKLVVNSGCRCPKHNAKEGGGKTSAHLTGEAVDIACASDTLRYRLISALLSVGFNRIGIAKTFLHADVSATLGQNCIWVY